MTKVTLVLAGYDWEGRDPIYIASTYELAQQWVHDHFEEVKPFPDDHYLKDKIVMKYKDIDLQYIQYDYIDIIEVEVDAYING